MIPVIFGITVISFMVIHLAPGKPTDLATQLNPRADFEAREKLAKIYGFDRPLYEQYFSWLKKVSRLDFGRSFVDQRPVAEKIAERLPVTLGINFAAIIIIFSVAVPLGVNSALKRGTFFDSALTVILFVLFAIPGFWLALVLMSFFGVRLGILPVSGIMSLDFETYTALGKAADITRHLILPVTVASVAGFAGISRYMRQSMLSVLGEDYVRTARAKGLSEGKVIYRHALRNALLPIITILGLSVPGLISGSVIIETVFGIPGMGRLMVESVFARDYNVIMAGLLVSAALTLLGNLLADAAYACADPRISTAPRP